jgi:hypothetical protein
MHIRRVQDNMLLLENNLNRLPFRVRNFELAKRGMLHDSDKVTFRIKNYFEIFKHFKFVREGIGDGGDIISADMVQKYARRHYLSQRHHMEYHIKNKIPLSGVDICEIACDLYAIKEELGETAEKTESFVIGFCKKFSIGDAQRKKLLFLLNLLGELTR